jgi:RNA polymerase sigma factor (sigma-70 family)
MAKANLGTVLRHLRRLGASRPGDDLSDCQLLDAFQHRRDEAAFAALLSRHGPTVLGVCRRVLRQEQDADDAFQATFLVLVRQANTIRRHDSLASWLYGVALRTAQRAKVDAARRRLREERAAVSPLREPSQEPDWRDLRAVIDEEIAGLPEPYRALLVLCHLEGQTNAQAARRLRLPLGSLSKRLARARGLLRGRLLRRGVALSAGALLTVLAGQAGAIVPPQLASAATGIALLDLAGSATLPGPVVSLADGVTRALFTSQVKGWLLGFAAFGLLLGGGLLLAPRQAPAPTPGDNPAPVAPAAPPHDTDHFDWVGLGDNPAQAVPAAPPADPPQRDSKDLDTIKRSLLLHGGGNAKSEAAVAAGLLWLVKQQAEDGHWSLDAPGGQKNDIAGTAFGLLPLLGAGHTHQDRNAAFARSVKRGLDFLIARQGKDGDFGGGTYAHALASSALFEAYALTGDPKLAALARAALDYIAKAQHEAGGWRYAPRQPGDLSVTVWQVAALHDARAAGLDAPKETLNSAAKFVRSCRTSTGGFCYMAGVAKATPTMTAAGLLSSSQLGANAEEESFRDNVHELAKEAPGTTRNAYYYYWAATLLHRYGGDEWDGWNSKLRNAIVERQKADGTWSAEGEPFAIAGGRIMVTSLTLLTLEAAYREDLPLAARASRPRTATELDGVWSDLAAADPITARRSVWALVGSPRQALPLLEKALTPKAPPTVDEKQLTRLIAELDDDNFEVREKASAALAKLGTVAGPALQRALKAPASAESRRRLEALLSALPGARFTPEHRRLLLAVEVLEHVGTPEAQRLLKRLAKETQEVDLARVAEAALERLAATPARQP